MGQIAGAMQGAGSKMFGSTDGLDPSGKALGSNATPDQLGITGGQSFARKALQGSLQGIGKGFQQQGGAPQAMAAPIQPPQAPMVDPSYFGVGRPKNPFYGN